MKRTANILLITSACLLASCSSTRENETSELRRDLRQQMNLVRTQLKTSGASTAQLRDFDKAMAELERQMRQLERQMQAMEKQMNNP